MSLGVTYYEVRLEEKRKANMAAVILMIDQGI